MASERHLEAFPSIITIKTQTLVVRTRLLYLANNFISANSHPKSRAICECDRTLVNTLNCAGYTTETLALPSTTTPKVTATTQATSLATTQSTTKTTRPLSNQSTGTCKNFEHQGELTVFSANPEGGNCDFPWDFIKQHSKAYTHFVALPFFLPGANAYDDHMSCGRCVRFKCNCADEQSRFPHACENAQGHEVIVMAVNSCPSCHLFGDLDLSNAAWDEVTGNQTHSR